MKLCYELVRYWDLQKAITITSGKLNDRYAVTHFYPPPLSWHQESFFKKNVFITSFESFMQHILIIFTPPPNSLKHTKFSLYWLIFLGMETTLCVWSTCWWPHHSWKLILSVLAAIRQMGLVPAFLSLCWAFVWLELCRSCACCPNCYEFIHASDLLCLANIVSLKPSIISGSGNLSESSSWKIPWALVGGVWYWPPV